MEFPLHAFLRAVLIAAIVFAGSGCATWKKMKVLPHRETKRATAVHPAPQRIGTITLVNRSEKFVLIDTGLAPAPSVGTALKSFTGETASGVVTVGNVNRRPFVVADIVQGSPTRGDAVFQ